MITNVFLRKALEQFVASNVEAISDAVILQQMNESVAELLEGPPLRVKCEFPAFFPCAICGESTTGVYAEARRKSNSLASLKFCFVCSRRELAW